jgi:hypothetical protein
MLDQDWETAVIRKKAPRPTSRQGVAEAKRRGEDVETEKKRRFILFWLVLMPI